jgi:anti-sigma28 factor (negative regulator of flagellin synthesis)
MKIQNSSLIPTNPLMTNTTGGTVETGNQAPTNSDDVQLSRLGAAVSMASAKLFNNSNRIETLTNSFKSGSYTVDPYQISQRIVDDALAA